MTNDIVSISAVKIGKWSVSGSVLKNDSICIIATMESTFETIVKFFTDEELAMIFVNNLGKAQLTS